MSTHKTIPPPYFDRKKAGFFNIAALVFAIVNQLREHARSLATYRFTEPGDLDLALSFIKLQISYLTQEVENFTVAAGGGSPMTCRALSTEEAFILVNALGEVAGDALRDNMALPDSDPRSLAHANPGHVLDMASVSLDLDRKVKAHADAWKAAQVRAGRLPK